MREVRRSDSAWSGNGKAILTVPALALRARCAASVRIPYGCCTGVEFEAATNFARFRRQKKSPARYYLTGLYMVRDHGFEPWTQGLRIWLSDFIWTSWDQHRIAEMLYSSVFSSYHDHYVRSLTSPRKAMCLWTYCGCVHKRRSYQKSHDKTFDYTDKIRVKQQMYDGNLGIVLMTFIYQFSMLYNPRLIPGRIYA